MVGSIRVGIGGWTYAPWRNNFFPEGLAHSKELQYASRALGMIEVNATYYGTMTPTIFKKWHDQTPQDFVFSIKANGMATNRRVLAGAGPSISRFFDSGISALGAKLGPIVWQFMPNKQFDAGDFEAFLALLPATLDGHRLRHVLDVRHDNFQSTKYLTLARKYNCATVFTDEPRFPAFCELTSDLVYCRLMQSAARLKNGYPPKTLGLWAESAHSWSRGHGPTDLPQQQAAGKAGRPRDVFVLFINGAKERAPAASLALMAQLRKQAVAPARPVPSQRV